MKPLDIDYDVNWRSRALKAEAQVETLQAKADKWDAITATDYNAPADAKEWRCPECGKDGLYCVHTRLAQALQQVTALRALLRDCDDSHSGLTDQRLRQQIRAALEESTT